MANPGPAAANLTMVFTRDDASPRLVTIAGLGAGNSFTAKLGPGATRLFVTDGKGDGSAAADQEVLQEDAQIGGLASIFWDF